jgi:hypothetical protein
VKHRPIHEPQGDQPAIGIEDGEPHARTQLYRLLVRCPDHAFRLLQG